MEKKFYQQENTFNITESDLDLKHSFADELNAALKFKHHLLFFVKNVKTSDYFICIEDPLSDLERNLKNQTKLLQEIYLLTGQPLPGDSVNSHEFNLIESMILNSESNNPLKRSLLFLTYLNMMEAKDKLQAKRLKSLARICDYEREGVWQSLSPRITTNFKKAFNSIAGTLTTSVACSSVLLCANWI